MAGREKRAPTPMSGPVRRSRAPTPVGLRSRATTPVPNRSRAATPVPSKRTLKTVETQTPNISRRPSISLQPPSKFPVQKRFSSPYVMRSESPVRTLRNGKQQKMKNSSLLLDGIPIVKRTRSLLSIESDTSSVISNATFNDSMSIDGFFNFNPPESPLEIKQNSTLDGSMTPRRGRVSRLSESSSIATSPLVAPRQKKLDLPSPVPLKQPPCVKEETPVTMEEEKKKRGRPASSPGPAIPVPAKKAKKLQTEVKVNIELEEEVKVTGKTGIKRKKLVATATVKKAKVVPTKGNKQLVKNESAKLKKDIVMLKKQTGRPLLKKTKQTIKKQQERKMVKVTRGKMNNALPKKTKGMLGKQKKRLIGKKLTMKVQLPMTKRKKQQVCAVVVKLDDPPLVETPSVEVKDVSTSEKATETVPVTKETEKTSDPEPPKTEESKSTSDNVARPEISIKEKPILPVKQKVSKLSMKEKASIKEKASKLSLRKVKKPVQKVNTESSLANDAQTLKTLTEASKILQRLAESDDNDKETNNENEESPKTPTPMSPNILNNLPVNLEVNGVCPGSEPQQDASHVSPLDSLANKLRRKLSQSPKLNSNEPSRLGKPAVSISTPLMKPLPIINSLSAAAKQTSSFLKNADEIELPGRKETQWKVNKKLIYHKIKPSKQTAVTTSKLNASLKGTMSSLFEKKSSSVASTTNKATSTVTKVLNKSETLTKPPVNRTPVIDTPVNNSSVNNTSVNGTPTIDTSINNTQVNDTAVNNTVVNKTQVNKPPLNKTPVNSTAVKTPVNNTAVKPPVNSTSVKTPVNSTAVNKPPVNKTSINKTPVNSTSVKTPVNSTSVKTPVNSTAVNKTPVNKTPVNKTPVNKTPVNKTTVNKPPVKTIPETKTATSTGMQNGEAAKAEKPLKLDSNENNVDAKLNQDAETSKKVEPEIATTEKLPEKEIVRPIKSSKITPIPEKDKPLIIDNHSEVVKKSSVCKNKSDKTEPQEKKKTAVKSVVESLPVEPAMLEPAPIIPAIIISEKPVEIIATPPPSIEITRPETPVKPAKQIEKEICRVPVLPDVPLSVIAASGHPVFPYDEEDLVAKVSVLAALGLQSTQSVSEQAKAPKVPKLRLVCRPTMKKHRRSTNHDASTSGSYKEKTYAVCREGDSFTDWEKPSPSKGSRDLEIDSCTPSLMWSPRMPISNGKALETFAEPTTSEPGVGVGDGLGGDTTEGGEKALVIPEKSSSFGIHPARLCEDVCCYCHNKFGLYDTPLHVAQLKGDEKQQAVLAREPVLTLESCLCDACFRHLDRPGAPKPHKPPVTKQKPQPNQTCCFKDCFLPAAHTMMRKWKRRVRTMMREEFQESKTTNWLCETHYLELARIGSCGICHRRLSSQQMYKLEGSAVSPLNKLLRQDFVPVTLDDTMSLCKKCRYYTSLRLRSEDHMKLNSGNRIFLREHRSRVLKALSVDPTSLPDVFVEQEKPKKQPKKKVTAEVQQPIISLPPPVPSTSTSTSTNNTPSSSTASGSGPPKQKLRFKITPPTRKMPTNARMSTGHRIPSEIQVTPTSGKVQSQLKLGSASGIKLPSQTRITLQPRPIAPAPLKVQSPDVRISPVLSRLAEKGRVTNNVPKVSLSKYRSASSTATSSQPPQVTIVPLTSRPTGSQYVRSPPPTTQREFPTNADVAMSAKFDFQPTDETSSWQKVNATFQFDRKTRQMWHNLHAPYGSYTSFLRHLVMLENHWRSGDLILSPTASVRSRQYLKSVHNRIQAYEGVPSDSSLGSVPLISDVRSLATSEGAGSWSMDPPAM